MRYKSYPGQIEGSAEIPASKSHTIRGLLLGSLASGWSRLQNPLDSGDARAAVRLAAALGAGVEADGDSLLIDGTGVPPAIARDSVDLANSGTSLFLGMAIAALGNRPLVFDGDSQLRSREAFPLISALKKLGARVDELGIPGCAPLRVCGPVHGGRCRIDAPTSQFLSALLLLAAASPEPVEILVGLLNEAPYVRMTLWWLDRLGIRYEASDDLKAFRFPGSQVIPAFQEVIPGDYSSATFPAVAAAITGGRVHLGGLRPDDPQGDSAVLELLGEQGCTVTPCDDRVTITGPGGGVLRGGTIDCNAIPDAVPALAIAGCRCTQPLSLVNVAHARQKETDRIAVMAAELSRLGVRCDEHGDGMTIHPVQNGRLKAGLVSSHGDHRVAMALAIAGLIADGPVEVDGAEVADITYPGFYAMLEGLRG